MAVLAAGPVGPAMVGQWTGGVGGVGFAVDEVEGVDGFEAVGFALTLGAVDTADECGG
jgi:hypothetical protein